MPLFQKNPPKQTISNNDIDPDAVSILRRLNKAGHTAYLVGGSVRDLILGRIPKDFDIATSASPRQVRNLFRNAFVIGRRFKLVLVRFGDKQIEVATFRRSPEPDDDADNDEVGALYVDSDNLFGTPEEDAIRRDFTVNALFYDITSSKIIDYTGGLRDASKRVLRSIGNPAIRFREDPVRMLRAVRLSARLDFEIHSESAKAITRHCGEIMLAAKPRLFEEIGRLFTYNKSEEAFRRLWATKLMSEMLPEVDEYINLTGKKKSHFWDYLAAFDSMPPSEETDKRSPHFIQDAPLRMAVLLAPLYIHKCKREEYKDSVDTLQIAETLIDSVLVHPYSTNSWRVPRLMCEDAAHILDSLFFQADENIRRTKYFRRPWLYTAIQFWKIFAIATGGKSDDLLIQSWEKAYDDFAAKHLNAGDGGAGRRNVSDSEWEHTELFPNRMKGSQDRSGGKKRRRRRKHSKSNGEGNKAETQSSGSNGGESATKQTEATQQK